jgi:hypothetical protein
MSGGGALTQLVALGAQNVYLTGNSERGSAKVEVVPRYVCVLSTKCELYDPTNHAHSQCTETFPTQQMCEQQCKNKNNN